jgi:hypothetical protein
MHLFQEMKTLTFEVHFVPLIEQYSDFTIHCTTTDSETSN